MSLLPVGIGDARSGYEIEKSLRFRASASAYLSRTFGPPTSGLTHTLSFWMKRGGLTGSISLLDCRSGTPSVLRGGLGLTSGGALTFVASNSSNVITVNCVTNALLRDPASHYHVVLVYDSTQATSSNRVKIYLNGALQTLSTASYPSLNEVSCINQEQAHRIASTASGVNYFDGYMSDIHFIDGQALDPSYFGKTDPSTGQWVPKAYTGSYGTNGFYLDFKDGTSLTTLGYDKSGNSNNWTLNNVSLTAGVTYDWMDDTPSNNFSVLNPLAAGITTATLAQANLSTTSAAAQAAIGTIGMASGSWYWEYSFSAATAVQRVGVYGTSNHTADLSATTNTIGILFDRDTGALDYTVDGANYTNIATGLTSGTYFPYVASVTNAKTMYANFGQRPFAYTPPTGFKALCTKNLTSDDVIESGTFTGNANANGPFVWCNGTPETLTINGNAVTWGTHADRLANGFKLRTPSTSYNAAGSNTWTATILSPERKSAFRNQRAKGNP